MNTFLPLGDWCVFSLLQHQLACVTCPAVTSISVTVPLPTPREQASLSALSVKWQLF